MVDPAKTVMILLFAQALLLFFGVVMSVSPRWRNALQAMSWLSSFLMIATLGAFMAATLDLVPQFAAVDTTTLAQYAGISVAMALLQWATRGILSLKAVLHDARLESDGVKSRAAEDLKAILRKEGMELDERLAAAEQEREAFLYALEERHARQIANLANEYQQESQTILRELLDQLAAEQLQPLVEQRLAEHRDTIESELGAIDSAAAGETLTTVRAELADLLAKVDAAEQRVEQIRAKNPDAALEERMEARIAEIEAQLLGRSATIEGELEERVRTVETALEGTLEQAAARVEKRIDELAGQLDGRLDVASNPLVARLQETQSQVEGRLNQYLESLNGRFVEIEELLSQRVLDQERALEERMVAMEQSIDGRLTGHGEAVERVLADHDSELQGALTEQGDAIAEHFAAERERLVSDLAGQAVQIQEQIAHDLASAEADARETIAATQAAWNEFTSELEERFAATREDAIRAAQEIAYGEREALEQSMLEIVHTASGDIGAKVEQLGREAAWQRAQVDRTVEENLASIQDRARQALADADSIFSDLERMGDERVQMIRRNAEDALVQSRQYVEQLEASLGEHLEALRTRSTELADEMNDRLASITQTSQHTVQQLDQYARQLLESVTGELQTAGEARVAEIANRISTDLAGSLQANLADQQRQYEQYLAEMSQRMLQQVQGDLTGMAEHARSAVTAELEAHIAQARDHVMRTQEQNFNQMMQDMARQQQELADKARDAGRHTTHILDESLREHRRHLEEAMASMGAHLREELVRFNDEGQRRVQEMIEKLRREEHDMLRDEDRKLTRARDELLRQHQGALENQFKSIVGGLSSGVFGSETSIGSTRHATTPTDREMTFTAQVDPAPIASAFAHGIERPATPMSSMAPGAAAPAQPPAGLAPAQTPPGVQQQFAGGQPHGMQPPPQFPT